MVEETHRAGLKLAAHCWTEAGAHNAAEASVDLIEHGEMMTDEDLQLAKKNHVVLVGTDFTESASRQNSVSLFSPRFRRPVKARVSHRCNDGLWHRCHGHAVPGETRGTLAAEYVDSWVQKQECPREKHCRR